MGDLYYSRHASWDKLIVPPYWGPRGPCCRMFANGLLGPTFNGLDAFYEDSVAGFICGSLYRLSLKNLFVLKSFLRKSDSNKTRNVVP